MIPPNLLHSADSPPLSIVLAGSSVWLIDRTAGERRGNTFNGFKDFGTKHGSSQGHKLALTGLCVPSSFDSRSEDAEERQVPSVLSYG